MMAGWALIYALAQLMWSINAVSNRFLISFYCDDRPGVVERLSAAVDGAQGNWLDSQLARLGGRFAGVVHVQLPADAGDLLAARLGELESEGITATLTTAGDKSTPYSATQTINLLGPDRPGIVLELTKALHRAGFNVQTLETTVETAPMSGEALFRAIAKIELLEGARLDELEWQLDAMAEAMTLEIDLQS